MADRKEGTGGMPDRVGLGDSVSARPGLGDDQGTRVGEPTPGSAREAAGSDSNPKERGETQSGKEASKGIRDANGGGAGEAGSEPLADREETHQSEYGGGGATKRGQNTK